MSTARAIGGSSRRLGAVCAMLLATLALTAPVAAKAATPISGFNEDAVGGLHGVSPDHYAGLVRTIGGNAIRTNLDWRLAEPEQDVWGEDWWGQWADLYEEALSRGVTPIFIIGSAPRWARATSSTCGDFAGPTLTHDPGFGSCELPPRPAMDVEWLEYATEVARRFPRAMIEVWNEPNTAEYWRPEPDPARYAELLTLAYHGIKAVSPRTRVISGGLLNVRRSDTAKGEVSIRDFLSIAYSAFPTIKGSADMIGLHAYPRGARVGARSRFAQAFSDVRAIRNANADPAPILLTETGVSTADLEFAPERRQAKALLRIDSMVDRMSDVAGVIYHRVIEPRDTTENVREHGYAWLRYGGSPLEPRRAFCAFVARAGRSYPAC